MAEYDGGHQTSVDCDGAVGTARPLDCDTNNADITLPSSETPASNAMTKKELLDNCDDSSIQNSELDDSADSLENQEFLSAESDSKSAASNEIYIDIYDDLLLSDEPVSDPDVTSDPPDKPSSLPAENDTSGQNSTSEHEDRRRDNFMITAQAQWEALKSFSDASIRTFPTQTSSSDICRICHCEADMEIGPLIAPCFCRGSLRYVHQNCLQQWIKSSNSKDCELCGYHFVMESKVKPVHKWKKLTMSPLERRKLLCTVMFHIIAITCVTWSLYVLIEKTAGEIQDGDLQWPFWTKLIVVGIGFIGGLVFMYIQCKVYVQLYKKLRAFNRVIYIKSHSLMTSSASTPEDPESGGVPSIPEDSGGLGGADPVLETTAA